MTLVIKFTSNNRNSLGFFTKKKISSVSRDIIIWNMWDFFESKSVRGTDLIVNSLNGTCYFVQNCHEFLYLACNYCPNPERVSFCVVQLRPKVYRIQIKMSGYGNELFRVDFITTLWYGFWVNFWYREICTLRQILIKLIATMSRLRYLTYDLSVGCSKECERSLLAPFATLTPLLRLLSLRYSEWERWRHTCWVWWMTGK